MSKTKTTAIIVLLILLGSLITIACSSFNGNKTIAFGNSLPSNYAWLKVTDKANYSQGYNYPVYVQNEKMFALHDGGWVSNDGKNWTKTNLPENGLNSAYQKYVQFKGAVYALGTMQGNYLDMKLGSKISRTRDFKSWETLAEKSNLPARVFYGAAVFKDKIWLIGGWDGKNYYNDVWTSDDGINWKRVAEKTDWSPRNVSTITVFKNKLWIFGGGVIDGEKNNNANSDKEVWTSEDGIKWTRIETDLRGTWRGTPVVFDNKLWLVGANRNDGFANGVLFSEDGSKWQEQSAPWSPRGAVAVWVYDNKLYMTGGKYSYVKNGETIFVYSNDVWYMTAKS